MGFTQKNVFLWAAICLLLSTDMGAADAGSPTRLAVQRLSGGDIPGLDFLSELVRQEIAKDDSLVVLESVLTAPIDPVDLNIDKIVAGHIIRLGDLHLIELRLVDVVSGQIERREETEFVGPLKDIRTPVRAVAQRLAGIGGFETLRDSHLHISSVPPGAGVFLNGLLEGKTPRRIRVAPHQYEVQVSLPGYRIWKQEVQVKVGETLSLNASLRPARGTQNYVQDGRPPLRRFAVLYAVFFAEGALHLARVESDRPYIGVVLAGAPLTYAAVSHRLSRADISVGRAWMIMSSGMWGAAWGALGAGSAALDESRPYVALSMGVSALGIYTATRATQNRTISRKRVSLVNLGGFLGSAVGLGIPYLFDASQTRTYTAGLLVGGITGVLGALHLTRGLDFVEDGEPSLVGSLLRLNDGGIEWGVPLPILDLSGRGARLGLAEARFY
ncbi:MAG: PEGA domain-containing protein [Candidatus Latescibacteria bacterium]|nr:PEGA domain-containing protein [Candidatus Latescibacterota bacterium]